MTDARGIASLLYVLMDVLEDVLEADESARARLEDLPAQAAAVPGPAAVAA